VGGVARRQNATFSRCDIGDKMALPGDKIDAEHGFLTPQWKAQPATITIAGSTDLNGSDLARGLYMLVADTACYFRQGSSSVEATSSDHYLPAGQVRYFWVETDTTDGRIAVIQKSAGGTMFIYSC